MEQLKLYYRTEEEEYYVFEPFDPKWHNPIGAVTVPADQWRVAHAEYEQARKTLFAAEFKLHKLAGLR
jgi:hypothetical protein